MVNMVIWRQQCECVKGERRGENVEEVKKVEKR